MITSTAIVIVCVVAAMSMAPGKVQAVVILGAIACMALYGGHRRSSKPTVTRVPDNMSGLARPTAPSASDRFEDAKAAIAGIAVACDRFDEHKAGETAAVLDECMYEYMKTLSREGVDAAAAYSSHNDLRDAVMSKVSEAYVVSDTAASAAVDAAAARLAALFGACDAVLLAEGKAQPGPGAA
jgi:hypothetical protein